MLVMVGCDHRGKPVHLRGDRPARDQHLAYREDALPRRRDCGGYVRSKDTYPNGDIAYAQTRETGFLDKAPQPLGGGLTGGQAALRHTGPLGREGIDYDPTADRCHGGKAADHEAIAAAGDERPLQEQTRDAGLARGDRAYLGDTSQDFGRTEVNPNARADREWLLGRGQQLQRHLEGARRRPPRACHGNVTAIDFFFGDTHEGERRAPSRARLIRVLAMHLDGAYADVAVQGQQPHARASRYGPAPGGAGHDRPRSGEREYPINRKAEEIIDGALGEILRQPRQRFFQILQPVAFQGRDSQRRVPAYSAVRQALGDFGPDQRQPFVIHQITFGEDGDAAPHAEQLDDGEVLLGLGHDAFVGGDDEQRDIDAGRAGEHVLDEPFMAGDVHDTRLDAARQWEGRKTEIDRDAAPLLFFPAVGVHAGERLHQRGLPVVDVASGTDYEPSGTHARRSQMSMALDLGSFPFRPVSSR